MNDGGTKASSTRSDCVSPPNPVAARPELTEQDEKFHLGYRPALDGLRGVAILTVIATHANMASGWAGDVGVDIFFVLSGFLITSLLIEERERFGSISLKGFYARRVLRLLPALIVMLAVVAIWHALTNPQVAPRTALDALIALFYSSNWMFALGLRQPVHVFAHTWTLSIEEQFYLWWPIVLILLLRRTGTRASLLHWVTFGMLILAVERVVLFAGMPRGAYNWLSYATDARADTLLMGCAAAVLLSSKAIPRDGKLRVALRYSAWLIGIPGLILIGIPAALSAGFCAIGLHIAVAFFAVLILLEAVVSKVAMLAWLLSRRWLVYIGKISYGLYLWHYPIFGEVQARKWPLRYELVIELGLTVFATVVSFYLIEQSALKLKRKFARVRKEEMKEGLLLADVR
jgi:peptidoglycan/LPS O-acetylase OafA/YrhL